MDALLHETHSAEQRHFWYRGFRRFVRPLLASAAAAVADVERRPRVLDAGCGTGANLGLLDEFGNAYGFDLTLSGLRLGRARGPCRVVVADAPRMPFADATFDIVTSFDVLACLDDRAQHDAIRETYRVLRPGGAAVISVPAFDVLRGEHAVFTHELRRYTRGGLCTLLDSAGFCPERVTCTNATLFVPLLIRRTWQRTRGLPHREQARSDFRLPPAAINRLLAGLLWLEAAVVARMDLPFGSTVVCLARKPRPDTVPHAA